MREIVRFPASGAAFVFQPVSVQTSRGPASVIVMGRLSARVENGVPTTLVVSMIRQTMTPDESSGSGGSSTKEIPWPQNDAVISFELPAPKDGASAGEQLSIRLQMTGSTLRGFSPPVIRR
jgi:hypothetical protein